jgi:hypothetical protein
VTSPPQPYRPRNIDLDLGVEAALPPTKPRQAANERQRKAAAADEEYERWRQAMGQELWPDWGKQ